MIAFQVRIKHGPCKVHSSCDQASSCSPDLIPHSTPHLGACLLATAFILTSSIQRRFPQKTLNLSLSRPWVKGLPWADSLSSNFCTSSPSPATALPHPNSHFLSLYQDTFFLPMSLINVRHVTYLWIVIFGCAQPHIWVKSLRMSSLKAMSCLLLFSHCLIVNTHLCCTWKQQTNRRIFEVLAHLVSTTQAFSPESCTCKFRQGYKTLNNPRLRASDRILPILKEFLQICLLNHIPFVSKSKWKCMNSWLIPDDYQVITY